MGISARITKVIVDARTPFGDRDDFGALFNRVTRVFDNALREAVRMYPDHTDIFRRVPFYDEHETEKVYADTWYLPEDTARTAMESARGMVRDGGNLLSSSSFIDIVDGGTKEVVLPEPTEAERLAHRYADKSPALFTKAVRRIDETKSCFVNSTLMGHIKKFIDIPDYDVRGVGFYSARGARQVCDFALLTYVYSGVYKKDREKYIEYARAYPEDVILAEDYLNDQVTPKDIPLGNVSKAEFLEAYWKLADRREA